MLSKRGTVKLAVKHTTTKSTKPIANKSMAVKIPKGVLITRGCVHMHLEKACHSLWSLDFLLLLTSSSLKAQRHWRRQCKNCENLKFYFFLCPVGLPRTNFAFKNLGHTRGHNQVTIIDFNRTLEIISKKYYLCWRAFLHVSRRRTLSWK